MRSTWLFSVLLLGLLLVAERGNFALKLCLVSLPENLTMVLFMSSVLHACAMDDILRGGDFVTHSLTRSDVSSICNHWLCSAGSV